MSDKPLAELVACRARRPIMVYIIPIVYTDTFKQAETASQRMAALVASRLMAIKRRDASNPGQSPKSFGRSLGFTRRILPESRPTRCGSKNVNAVHGTIKNGQIILDVPGRWRKVRE